MQKRTKIRLGALVALTATLAAGGSWAAIADPAAGTYPTLAGVGSDTIQDVMNGIATKVSAIGSYDAVDPNTQAAGGTIVTRSGGNPFTRPNGSGDGINALSASNGSASGTNFTYKNTNIQGYVDFARSSSGPSVSGTNLTYIPFAQDAVTFAVNEASDFPRDIPLGSSSDAASKFTLYNIYHCNVTSYTNANGDAVTIIPLLPQQGSGTRKFWLSKVGLVEGSLPSCVTDLNNTVEENSGKQLTDPGDIVPFSIAQFISQGNYAALPSPVRERRYAAQLGRIGGASPYIVSNGVVSQNPNFPVNRLVYNVVPTSKLSDSTISATFVGSSSAVCQQSAIIKAYGFSTISNCGATNIQGGFTQ